MKFGTPAKTVSKIIEKKIGTGLSKDHVVYFTRQNAKKLPLTVTKDV